MAPTQRYAMLRKLVPKFLHPFLRDLRKRLALTHLELPEPFRTVYPYTQVSPSRQENILRLARIIEDERIPGAIVEFAVKRATD